MTTTETTPLDAARDAVRAKTAEVEAAEQALADLQAQRRDNALAGTGTKPVRTAIADAEAHVDDLRMQLAPLLQVVTDEEAAKLHRERQAALAEVYRRDVEFLKADKLVAKKRTELEQATEAIAQFHRPNGWYDPQLQGRGHPNPDLSSDRVREAPVKLAPLRTQTSAGPGQEPKPRDIDFDIARLEKLADEAENESAGEAGSVRRAKENE